MTIPQIKIVNCETGEEIIRDMNEKEIKQKLIDEKNTLKAQEEAKAKAKAKAALLERLGITEEEAKLLLGGN